MFHHYKEPKSIRLLGKRIRELRKSQKISQVQLAFEASLPREQVSRIERGTINSRISTILAIARALQVHVKDLFIEEYFEPEK